LPVNNLNCYAYAPLNDASTTAAIASPFAAETFEDNVDK
jgi:hypothetical protein